MLRTAALIVLLSYAAPAAAQGVKLEFINGRVNLTTQNASVGAILAEWARLGGTRIVNGDRVAGPPMTLELQGYPERQVLDIVLRGVAGYMLAAREVQGAGASYFDRIMILPTSTAPRPASTAANFAPPQPAQTFNEPQDDADDDDVPLPRELDDRLRRAEEQMRRRTEQMEQAERAAQPNRIVVGQPIVPGTPGAAAGGPNVPPTFVIGGPNTSGGAVFTVPGPANGAVLMTPPAGTPQTGTVQAGPQSRPSSLFTTLPGSSRPGEITPLPTQQGENPPNDR